MEWLLIAVFVIFMIGICIVTMDAIKHAGKKSPNKPAKPIR